MPRFADARDQTRRVHGVFVRVSCPPAGFVEQQQGPRLGGGRARAIFELALVAIGKVGRPLGVALVGEPEELEQLEARFLAASARSSRPPSPNGRLQHPRLCKRLPHRRKLGAAVLADHDGLQQPSELRETGGYSGTCARSRAGVAAAERSRVGDEFALEQDAAAVGREAHAGHEIEENVVLAGRRSGRSAA